MQHGRLLGDDSDLEGIVADSEVELEPFWCWQRLIGLPVIFAFVLLLIALAFEWILLY